MTMLLAKHALFLQRAAHKSFKSDHRDLGGSQENYKKFPVLYLNQTKKMIGKVLTSRIFYLYDL